MQLITQLLIRGELLNSLMRIGHLNRTSLMSLLIIEYKRHLTVKV